MDSAKDRAIARFGSRLDAARSVDLIGPAFWHFDDGRELD